MATQQQRVVITDGETLLEPAIALLRQHGVDVVALPGGDMPAKEEALATADAVIVNAEPLTAEQIERAVATGPLGLAIRCGVGYDLIDVPAATRSHVWVANIPDYCTEEVADHTLGLILAVTRRLPYFLNCWRDGWDWFAGEAPVYRLRGMTLGIVGAGRIGRAVAKRAQAFGLQVIAADPIPPPDLPVVPLPKLLRQADIVSLHTPYNDSTHHLMCDETFALMKEGSILINTSRGRVVDSAALLRALETHRPEQAALDVLEDEPHPDLRQPLLSHPRVLITPHAAYYSRASGRDLAIFSAENVLRYLRGERPNHLVNPGARA